MARLVVNEETLNSLRFSSLEETLRAVALWRICHNLTRAKAVKSTRSAFQGQCPVCYASKGDFPGQDLSMASHWSERDVVAWIADVKDGFLGKRRKMRFRPVLGAMTGEARQDVSVTDRISELIDGGWAHKLTPPHQFAFAQCSPKIRIRTMASVDIW